MISAQWLLVQYFLVRRCPAVCSARQQKENAAIVWPRPHVFACNRTPLRNALHGEMCASGGTGGDPGDVKSTDERMGWMFAAVSNEGKLKVYPISGQ